MVQVCQVVGLLSLNDLIVNFFCFSCCIVGRFKILYCDFDSSGI